MHQKVRLGDRAEAVQLSALFFVRYAAAAKEPDGKRCFAGAVASRQGVAANIEKIPKKRQSVIPPRLLFPRPL